MTLAASDWAAIVGYLLITLFLGLYFRGRSGKSTEDYFVSGRYWTRLCQRGGGELAVVEFSAVGNDDGVPVRASVAPFGAHYRRAIRGDALRRQAGRVPARFPRGLPRAVDELLDPRLGDQGHGEHH